jgi:hypothetical protein
MGKSVLFECQGYEHGEALLLKALLKARTNQCWCGRRNSWHMKACFGGLPCTAVRLTIPHLKALLGGVKRLFVLILLGFDHSVESFNETCPAS